ncbi:MAG: hypothetical protein ACRD2L_03310 [Terriglobia bacterium]
MPLSEKVRIELFIPDLPDPIYFDLLERLGDELSYAFGGCTGKYRAASGLILPDKINILFTDTAFVWELDQEVIARYAAELQDAVSRALKNEEAILVAAYEVRHSD